MKKPTALAVLLMSACATEPDEADLASTEQAAAGALKTRLWTDHKVHYVIDHRVRTTTTTGNVCPDTNAKGECELPMRDRVQASIAYIEARTSLDFIDESPPPGELLDTDKFHELIDHPHPHLFVTTFSDGQTWSTSSLLATYAGWYDRCTAAKELPFDACYTNRLPSDPGNVVQGTPQEDLAYLFGMEMSLNEDGVQDDRLVDLGTGANLMPLGVTYASVMLHETGHALGMSHEQNRPDRGAVLNFYPCFVRDTDFDGQPDLQSFAIDDDMQILSRYDMTGIMQYDSSSKCIKDASGNCTGYPLLAIDSPYPGAVWKSQDCPGTPVTGGGYTFENLGSFTAEDRNVLVQLYPERRSWLNELDDRLGAALAAGDFDGDGYRDLAVGAPGEGVGSNNTPSGAVYVWKGTYTGLHPWKRLYLTSSPASGDLYGSALAAGDVDGDGADELLVGAPGRGAGAVYRYAGGELGPVTSTVVSTGLMMQTTSRYGAALVVADVTGGGQKEIVVGAPGANRVYVFSGPTLFATVAAPSGASNFGTALAVVDVNVLGPSAPDLIIGAPASGTAAGAVYVALGSAGGIGAPRALTAPGYAGDRFGAALAAGSFPGGKVAIGAPGHNESRGRTYLAPISANLDGTLSTGTLKVLRLSDAGTSDAVNGEFGAALATVASGKLAVGAPGAGKVAYYTSSDFAGAYLYTEPTYHNDGVSSSTPRRFGAALAGGDFNDDSRTDLAIGVPYKPHGGDPHGAVWVARGSASPWLPQPFFMSTDDSAKSFATYLDQDFTYDHWIGTSDK